jgi:hypothetical protein
MLSLITASLAALWHLSSSMILPSPLQHPFLLALGSKSLLLLLQCHITVYLPSSMPEPSAVKLDAYLQNDRVPLAGLAYPRYKIATVSLTASDVELHIATTRKYTLVHVSLTIINSGMAPGLLEKAGIVSYFFLRGSYL